MDEQHRAERMEVGGRLAGFVYGTIVALSVIVGAARAYPGRTGPVAVLVAVTSAVFWIAHVYAHALGGSVAQDEHLSFAELRRIARREAAIIEATVPLIGVLLLGAIGVLSAHASVWIAFLLGLVVLAVQGLRFAHTERLGIVATVVVVAVNLGLGLMIVGVKLLLPH